MTVRKTAMVSYSHDSEEHIEWVHQFTNDLRERGLDVETDRMVSEHQTVHFQQMMNKLLRKKDYVIVILTENYARRSEDFIGGAGYEGQIISSMLQNEPDKLIFCYFSSNQGNAIPHHLNGYYYIDFTDESKYNSNLQEIIDRTFKIPRLEIKPLGPIPTEKFERDMKENEEQNRSEELFNLKVPAKKPNDLEKSRFLKKEFTQLVIYFEVLMEQLRSQRAEYEFEIDKVSEFDVKITGYLDGQRNTGVYLRLNSTMGSECIALSYGRLQSFGSGNSMNEIIYPEVDEENKLYLSLTMGIYLTAEKPTEPKEIVQYIWENHLRHDFN